MTAAGITPHGLPYPGSGDPVYNIPNYLQALADAVESNLSASGTAQPTASWVGKVSTNSNGFVFIPIPALSVVRGGIAMSDSSTGGSGPWLFFLSQTSWTDANQRGKAVLGVAKPTADAGYPGYPGMVKSTGNIGVCLLVWGDPA